MNPEERKKLNEPPPNLRPNLLPIFNKERTRMSIGLWNISQTEREAIPARERAETRRRLIKAAKKFGISVNVER